MIRTPLTKHSIDRLNSQLNVVEAQSARARFARREISEHTTAILSNRAVPIWCFAIGLFAGSRRKVTKVVERPTKTIKRGPTLLSILNTAFSVAALKYKTQRVIVEQLDNEKHGQAE